MESAIFLLTGIVVGAGGAYLVTRSLFLSRAETRIAEEGRAAETEKAVLSEKVSSLEKRVRDLEGEKANFNLRIEEQRTQIGMRDRQIAEISTTLEQERKSAQEKLAILEEATEKLKATFEALSSEALKTNNRAFLELAKTQLDAYQKEAKLDLEKRQEGVAHLLGPIKESFQKFDKKIEDLEKGRTQDYGGITEHLKTLVETQQNLRAETGKLVNALRRPQARGRWGEIQLRNVIELAGMSDHCDFEEQVSTDAEEGGRLRPDLVVNLPGGKKIVIDSKVSLDAFMNAIETEDEDRRREFLENHARQVRTHIGQLSKKEYWKQFDFTPDFVVLFLPGEVYFSAALTAEASLIEEAARNRVVLASPTTLIALLKAVAFGWQQEKVAENAREIARLGKELHDRIRIMGEHFNRVGENLGRATEAYNKSLRSLETRVLVSARRFQELNIGADKEVPSLLPVEIEPSPLIGFENGEENPSPPSE